MNLGHTICFTFDFHRAEKVCIRNNTGREAMKIFNKYNVFEYSNSFYDILHSNGQEYIIQDIDVFIKSREKSYTIN